MLLLLLLMMMLMRLMVMMMAKPVGGCCGQQGCLSHPLQDRAHGLQLRLRTPPWRSRQHQDTKQGAAQVNAKRLGMLLDRVR